MKFWVCVEAAERPYEFSPNTNINEIPQKRTKCYKNELIFKKSSFYVDKMFNIRCACTFRSC